MVKYLRSFLGTRALLREAVFLRAEFSITDLAADLTFRAIVLIEIRHRGIASWAFTGFRDITFRTSRNRFKDFTIALLVVFQKPLIFNGFIVDDFGKDIGFEFLILRRMAVIKSPLLQRNIFSDKK